MNTSPRIPFVSDKTHADLNAITQILTDTCGTSTLIYAEALKPAVGRFVLVLVTFGLGDVVRGFFRPKGIHPKGGRKRGREGGRGGKRAPGGIPELGNLTGQKLAAFAQFEPVVDDGLRMMWLIDEAFQRVGYAFLIADAIGDATYVFATGLIQPKIGANCFALTCSGRNQNHIYDDIITAWQDPGPLDVISGPCASPTGAQWIAGPKGGLVTWSVTAKPQNKFVPGARFDTRIIVNGEVRSFKGSAGFLGNQTKQANVASLDPGDHATCQIKIQATNYIEAENHFTGISF